MNLTIRLRRLLSHPYVGLAIRLYIGGLFIHASMYKINYAAEFADTIASYQLIPYWATHLMALIMPWMELICGVLLVLGIRTRSAAALVCGLLILFSVTIFITLLRDLPIGCGCFHALDEQMTWLTLVRDLAWLALAFQLYRCDSAWQLERKFLLIVREL